MSYKIIEYVLQSRQTCLLQSHRTRLTKLGVLQIRQTRITMIGVLQSHRMSYKVVFTPL